MPHPYSDLPGEAFWRTAVSEKSPLQFSALYRKKFSIFPNDVIATAGSCFAQHIARHLVRNGYNFRDFEKAPPFIPEKRRSEYGYGIYSARYANIYTVRQLLQTLRRAFGHFTPQEQVWGGGGTRKDSTIPSVQQLNRMASVRATSSTTPGIRILMRSGACSRTPTSSSSRSG